MCNLWIDLNVLMYLLYLVHMMATVADWTQYAYQLNEEKYSIQFIMDNES